MPLSSGVFQCSNLLRVALIPGVYPPQSLPRVFAILFPCYLSIRSFCYVFLFPYLTPKLFCFHCIQLLVCPRAVSTYLLVEFSFFILKCLVLIVLLDPVSVSFKSPFFRQYLLFYLFKFHF